VTATRRRTGRKGAWLKASLPLSNNLELTSSRPHACLNRALMRFSYPANAYMHASLRPERSQGVFQVSAPNSPLSLVLVPPAGSLGWSITLTLSSLTFVLPSSHRVAGYVIGSILIVNAVGASSAYCVKLLLYTRVVLCCTA